MIDIWPVLFMINLALLFVHEMDAVKNREWRMFAMLKNMADEKACRLFILLHIPLYVAILLILMSPVQQILFYIIDIFLIFHAIIHLGFRNHKNNAFTSMLSQGLIYSMGAISAVHLAGISLTA